TRRRGGRRSSTYRRSTSSGRRSCSGACTGSGGGCWPASSRPSWAACQTSPAERNPMHEVAPGVWMFSEFFRAAVNCYLAGGVLIDTGTVLALRRLLRELRTRRLSAVALTHCHPDHRGCARAVCRAFGVPLWCPAGDAAAMENREAMWPHNWALRVSQFLFDGPPYRVSRALRDGDEVAGFRVVAAPGLTPGHTADFREAGCVLHAGHMLCHVLSV